MDAEEIRSIVDRYLNCYNMFDIAGMMNLIHPEIEFRNFSGGEVTAQASGEDQFRKLVELTSGLFSEREQALKNMTIESDVAVADIEYSGVLKTDLPSGQKAGETLHLTGQSAFHFKDGKIFKIIDKS